MANDSGYCWYSVRHGDGVTRYWLPVDAWQWNDVHQKRIRKLKDLSARYRVHIECSERDASERPN